MDGIWPPSPPELYQINVHVSKIKARKTLEQRVLRPLSSNLMSEVIQALRNRTHLSQYSTKEPKEALKLRLLWPLHSLSMKDAV